MLLFILLLAFLAGSLLAMALAGRPLNAERAALSRRLAALSQPANQSLSPLPSLADAEFEGDWQERLWQPIRQKLALLGARLSPQGTSEHLRQALAQAGRPAGLGVREFVGLRLVSGVIFCLLALPLSPFIPLLPVRLLLVGLFLIIGLTLPESLLQQKVRQRTARIRRALPDMVDLLVVSVEAGLSLDRAFRKVTEKTQGPLADEMRYMLDEMYLGQTRGQALKAMSARLEIAEVKTFVAAVCQADQLGTSIARTLRAQSEMARVGRMQRLREEASRLPVTLLFPLVLFVFPAVFVVLIGPSLIRLYQALSHL